MSQAPRHTSSALGPAARAVLSAPEQISKAITEAILQGTLSPGDRLPSEGGLAQTFGVSRPTVRQALRSLTSRHILETKRGRNGGYRVARFHLPDLAQGIGELLSLSIGTRQLTATQLSDVRQALEVLSAQVAARHRTENDLHELTRELPSPSHNGSNHYDLLAADLRFHRALAQATQNPLLVSFIEATTAAFHSIDVNIEQLSPDMVVGHLPALLQAVTDQDEPAAADAMRLHLSYFAAYVAEQPSDR